MGSLHPAIDHISGTLFAHNALALSKKSSRETVLFCLTQFVERAE
jgi:hypothetical protein